MEIQDYIIMGVAAVALLYVIVIYNNLVTLKNNIAKNWSNIDVLLKQRHDELPKLVETCKKYMQYEKATLEEITKARAEVMNASRNGDVAALGMAETHMRMGLNALFARAEAYPDLKADSSFQHLQARISTLENGIADRREFFNASVNLNNIRIQQFPDVIIAKILGFKKHNLLEFSEAELKDVNIGDLFR